MSWRAAKAGVPGARRRGVGRGNRARAGRRGKSSGRGGSQLVALWHDRSWDPVRVFRRGDGATIVVFQVIAMETA